VVLGGQQNTQVLHPHAASRARRDASASALSPPPPLHLRRGDARRVRPRSGVHLPRGRGLGLWQVSLRQWGSVRGRVWYMLATYAALLDRNPLQPIFVDSTASHRYTATGGIWWKAVESTRSHQIPPDPTRSHQIPPDPTRSHQIPPISCVLELKNVF
jgi:hypothetical protein